MKILSLLLVLASCLPASITSVNFANTSPADLTATGTRVREFRTGNTLGGVTNAGNTWQFTNHFQWMTALLIPTGGATVANIQMTYPAYEIGFVVQDPGNVGYTLRVDSVIRGLVESLLASGTSGTVATFGTSWDAYLDTGSGFALNLPLTVFGQTAQATVAAPAASVLQASTVSHVVGTFTGTRTFGIRFTNNPSPAITQSFSNNLTGETVARFGMTPTLADFTLADYPGVDGEAPSQHGHFLTIAAEFNASSAVPEPAAGGLLLLGCLLGGVRALRRRR